MQKKERSLKIPQSQLKVALITDCIYGNTETVRKLIYILKIFPNSRVFTPYFEESVVKGVLPKNQIQKSTLGFLLSEQVCTTLHSKIQILAFRNFNLKDFDIVISLTSNFAKFVKVPKNVRHISIITRISKCLTSEEVSESIKRKDKEVMKEIDYIITISNYLKRKIKRVYGVNSDVIYPPVDISKIKSFPGVNRRENWFLTKGSLPYRDLRLVIKSCIEANVPLKVYGELRKPVETKDLVRNLGAKGLIKFVSIRKRNELMQRCKAFIFPHRFSEFSISTVEANAFGTPVIAYRGGSNIETISEKNPKTGVFFRRYKVNELAKILKNFKVGDFNTQNCLIKAEEFDAPIFLYKLKNYVEDVVQSK